MHHLNFLQDLAVVMIVAAVVVLAGVALVRQES